MFGNLVSGGRGNTHDHKRTALDVLNDDRLTPAQKSAYCFDQGVCDTCGVKTHFVGPFKRRPYTNAKVFQGICRTCHPDEEAALQQQPETTAGGLGASWNQLQKQLVVPPDALLAKTSTAFTSFQTSVTKGMNNLNDNLKQTNESGAVKEQQQKMAAGTNRALTSLHSSLTVGVNHMKDGITSATNKGEQFISSKKSKPSQQQKQPPASSGLENHCQANQILTGSTTKKSEGVSSMQPHSQENDGSQQPSSLEGKMASTPFGKGQVISYRPDDDIYEIHLHHNSTMPPGAPRHQLQSSISTKQSTKLFCKRECFSVEDTDMEQQKQSMELNDAYESLEKMRRLNLELECQAQGVSGGVDFERCTMCLLYPEADPQNHKNFSRIRQLVHEQKKQKAAPCLFCAAPSCQVHSCPTFRKEGITACQECVRLFEPDYIVDCVNHSLNLYHTATSETKSREQHVNRMIDLYDRVLLLLQYSSQYIESTAAALEESTKKSNNVNAGASSVGIVSGALGVAAAAALFTPAGPPLLVASLMLGGGATAAQTGTEVKNYYSEPKKIADRIIVLTAMIHSLLRVKDTLREVLTTRLLKEEGNPEVDRLKKSLGHLDEKQRSAALVAGTTVASTAMLGGVAISAVEVAAGAASVESAALLGTVEVGTLAGRNANMLSKSGTAIARGARFARFAGGALSAATLALEAKTLSTTIQQIKAGHPCEKADTLRAISKELPLLPTTEELDNECQIYMAAMNNRMNATQLEDAITLIEKMAIEEWKTTNAKSQGIAGDLEHESAETGALILDGEEDAKKSDGTIDLSLLESSLKMAQEQRLSQSLSELPEPKHTHADQNNHSAVIDRAVPAERLAQSMTQLPSAPAPSENQAALLERIQKFKQEECFCSTSTSADSETSAVQILD